MTKFLRSSSMALGLGLAIAAGGLAADPAAAQRKKKEDAAAEAAKPKYSKGFLEAIGAPKKAGETVAVETEITGQQWDAALARVRAAEQAQGLTPDDQHQIAFLKVRIGQGKNDNALLKEGIAAAIASPQVKPEDRAKFQRNLAALAIQSNDYSGAAKIYEEILAGNPADTAVASDLARIYYRQKQPAQAMAAIDKAEKAIVASGQKPPEDLLAMRFQLAYDSKAAGQVTPAAIALVRAYPTDKNWENAIIALRQQGTRMDEQLDLDTYRLQHATRSLTGQGAYLDYANSAFQRGLPAEARRILTEGQQKGVIPAGSQTSKELTALIPAAKVTEDRNSLPGGEKAARAAKTGRLARATADAFMSHGDYAKAIELYTLALEKGGEDAAVVNTRIGIANAMAGNRDAAKAALAKVQGGPRGDLARWWEVYIDTKANA